MTVPIPPPRPAPLPASPTSSTLGQPSRQAPLDTTAPWLSEAEKRALQQLSEHFLARLPEWLSQLKTTGETESIPPAASASPPLKPIPSWADAFFAPAEEAHRAAERDAWERYKHAATPEARHQALQEYMRLTQRWPGTNRTETLDPGVQLPFGTHTPAHPEGVNMPQETFPAEPAANAPLSYPGAPATSATPWHTELPAEAALPLSMLHQGVFKDHLDAGNVKQLIHELATLQAQQTPENATVIQAAMDQRIIDFYNDFRQANDKMNKRALTRNYALFDATINGERHIFVIQNKGANLPLEARRLRDGLGTNPETGEAGFYTVNKKGEISSRTSDAERLGLELLLTKTPPGAEVKLRVVSEIRVCDRCEEAFANFKRFLETRGCQVDFEAPYATSFDNKTDFNKYAGLKK